MRHKIVTAGNKRVLKFDCDSCEQDPSIANSPICMEEVIEQIKTQASVSKVVLGGKYVQEYRGNDLDCLKQYAQAIDNVRYQILKTITGGGCHDCEKKRRNRLENILDELKREPTRGLMNLKQLEKELEETKERGSNKCQKCRKYFLQKGINPAVKTLSETNLIKKSDSQKNSREKYTKLFKPKTRPNFLRSKLELKPPEEPHIADAYEVNGTKVRIYYSPKKLEHLYFVIPPAYSLPPEQVDILQDVRAKLLDRHGSLDPSLARTEIEKRSRKLIMETALENKTDLEKEKVEELAKSLARFTAGLGIIEILLEDEKIQDIYVDAPVGENPVYIYHSKFEECFTNIFITPQDAQVLTSRFRAISGRPFSEANPTLNLNLGKVRVAAIQKPLSPAGLAFAIRRHKSTPWTLPLFIQKNFLTPKAAGLLSLLVDSQASLLVTGSRGAGKTSLLGALMLELLPKYRILCLEDTAELPIKELCSFGYKAQRLQVRPSSSGYEIEMSTEDALRAALRLGESVLIIGEVRGPETKSLYEAMRVGAAGNSVMGTIHGSSTKDVFERVVYDLDIPASSFKATDVIVVASPIRVKGSVNRVRRLSQISEVGKNWSENPMVEDGFSNLMFYEPEEDQLKTSTSFEEGNSVLLESIASKWSMNIQELKKNLETRTKIQETLVRKATSGNPRLLEAEQVVKSNLAFHRFLEKEFQNRRVDYDRLYSRWEKWLNEVSQ